MIEFKMPSLGADMEAGTLCEWLVKPGDPVKRGDIIAIVDTQKGLIDIEVFDTGIIDQLLLRENEKVPVGTVMALIRGDKESPTLKEIPTGLAAGALPTPQVSLSTRGKKRMTTTLAHGVRASPLARKIAAEKGVVLTDITGSGEGGAITKEDVERLVNQKEGSSKIKPLVSSASITSVRKAVAAAMSRSNREIPHYYLTTRVDMRSAMNWLSESNRQRPVRERLLPVTLLIKAVAAALLEVPELNGYWQDGLVLQKEIHLGFVVSLRGGGVMIPALHDAPKKTIGEVMQWLNEIIPRARALNLRSSDLSDATLTITSLGENQAEEVYGVVYPPQLALVGFGTIREQPWAENGMLDVRPILTVTLAADHRATDGQTGSRFLMAINHHLQKPELL